jgi:hypothetical protein
MKTVQTFALAALMVTTGCAHRAPRTAAEWGALRRERAALYRAQGASEAQAWAMSDRDVEDVFRAEELRHGRAAAYAGVLAATRPRGAFRAPGLQMPVSYTVKPTALGTYRATPRYGF